MGEDVVTSPGTRVLVHGLYRCTDLNGKIGIVLDAGEGAERGRYLLRIEGTEKIVSINGWNFTIVQSKPKVPLASETMGLPSTRLNYYVVIA